MVAEERVGDPLQAWRAAPQLFTCDLFRGSPVFDSGDDGARLQIRFVLAFRLVRLARLFGLFRLFRLFLAGGFDALQLFVSSVSSV